MSKFENDISDNSQYFPGCTAIIAAGGSSRRMDGADKLLEDLDGKPVIARTLEVFDGADEINEIIIVSSAQNIDRFREIIKMNQIKKVRAIVEGGIRRQDSVYKGLLEVKTKHAAVHDGARPLVSRDLLGCLLRESAGADGCIPGIPLKDTIKIIDDQGFALETPQRENFRRIQIPQVFLTHLLIGAYEKIFEKGIDVTDDASAMERFGYKIRIIPGEEENIKITTPEDVELARFLFKRKFKFDG